jgi:acid phosphatase class B
MSPIIPTASLTRSVDVMGIMAIRRVFSDGFASFESMCEGCKNSSGSLSSRSVDVNPLAPPQDQLESKIPTIVKYLWQNTSVFATKPNFQAKTSFSSQPGDYEAAPSDVDTLASQMDEIEVRRTVVRSFQWDSCIERCLHPLV